MKKIIFLFTLFFSFSFYAQNNTLSIVKHTDKDIVIPKNLKLVFRGIENELYIDVPNAKSFEVSGNGITKKSKNTYNLNPGAGLETTLQVDIVLKNNKKITEKHVFRIRNINSVLSTFNKIEGGIIKLQKSGFKDGVVDVKGPDKNFEDIFTVTQFTLKIPGMPAIVIDGNKIDDKTFEKINKNASKGDQITIFDIRIKTIKLAGAHICGISPIVIQIL